MKRIETNQKRSEEKLTAEQKAVILQPPGKSESIEQEAVREVKRAIGIYNKRFQYEVLSAMLADVSKTTDRADRLIAMEPKVRAIVERLDVKTKALISVLIELSAVESQSIGVDYGSDILWNTLRDIKHGEAAIKEHPEDVDLACLSEVYELARFINNADAKSENPAEPEAVEEVSTKAETQGNPGLRTIKQWLSNRTYSEKLCAILMWQLINKASTFDEPDDDIGNRTFSKWEEEIIEASGDIKKLVHDNSGLSEESVTELVAVTSTAATWIPMEV